MRLADAEASFRMAAENAATEDELDEAWGRWCANLVEEFGNEAANRFGPIDDAARGRIQIEQSGPRAA